jgi:hypothetical protein
MNDKPRQREWKWKTLNLGPGQRVRLKEEHQKRYHAMTLSYFSTLKRIDNLYEEHRTGKINEDTLHRLLAGRKSYLRQITNNAQFLDMLMIREVPCRPKPAPKHGVMID